MFRISAEAAGAMMIDEALLWCDIDAYEGYMERKAIEKMKKKAASNG